MRRSLLAGGGVVAVMLAIALLVQRCAGLGEGGSESTRVTADSVAPDPLGTGG